MFCAKKSSYHQYTSSLCSYHIWTSKENLFKMAAGATPQPIHKRLELYVTPGHFLDFEISDQCEFQQDYFKSYIKQGDSILMINCKYINPLVTVFRSKKVTESPFHFWTSMYIVHACTLDDKVGKPKWKWDTLKTFLGSTIFDVGHSVPNHSYAFEICLMNHFVSRWRHSTTNSWASGRQICIYH